MQYQVGDIFRFIKGSLPQTWDGEIVQITQINKENYILRFIKYDSTGVNYAIPLFTKRPKLYLGNNLEILKLLYF